MNRYACLKRKKNLGRSWMLILLFFTVGRLPFCEYWWTFKITPVVEIVLSVSVNTVIPVLDKVLSLFGYTNDIKSDNSSPFNAQVFSQFAESSGFKLRHIKTRWSQVNVQTKSFNKSLMESERVAFIEKNNWKQEMFKFLRQYRCTPHPSTRFSYSAGIWY